MTFNPSEMIDDGLRKMFPAPSWIRVPQDIDDPKYGDDDDDTPFPESFDQAMQVWEEVLRRIRQQMKDDQRIDVRLVNLLRTVVSEMGELFDLMAEAEVIQRREETSQN